MKDMTQEEKSLLLKDLSARLPYGIMCHANEINLDGELLFINKVYNIVAVYNDKATRKFDTCPIVNFDTCPIVDIKPYLRPMSSMTEEEKREYNLTKTLSIVDYPTLNSFDWLNAHHFDYRNLIEKGLAIEITEENTPYKD